MKQIFLIAWREYKEYIFSRGFLLSLVLFPLGVVLVGAAMGLIERNKPLRYFTVYDEVGAYTEAIDEEIERLHWIDTINAWDDYVMLASRPGELDDIPAPFAPAQLTDRRLAAFIDAGGLTTAQGAAAPYLRAEAGAFEPLKKRFQRVALPKGAANAKTLQQVETALRPYLLGEALLETASNGQTLFAAILIPETFSAADDNSPAQYWSRNLTDRALESAVKNALDSALQRQALQNYGLPENAYAEVIAIDAPFSSFRPDKVADQAKLGLKDQIETGLPVALTYMLLVIVFNVGYLLLTNTVEERSNKIVEMLLSSVTANQLMAGKLIGVAAVGLTMPAIFVIGGGVAVLVAAGADDLTSTVISALFSNNFLAIYLFYFVCAYLMFAMVFLAIGAISNSMQDAQSYMGSVMLVLFAPIPVMLLVFQNPNGVAATILTWIPIYTPYAILMRAAADPPLWEILGATALMLALIVFMIRVLGRIFRQALLQASPPKLKEVWRLAQKDAI